QVGDRNDRRRSATIAQLYGQTSAAVDGRLEVTHTGEIAFHDHTLVQTVAENVEPQARTFEGDVIRISKKIRAPARRGRGELDATTHPTARRHAGEDEAHPIELAVELTEDGVLAVGSRLRIARREIYPFAGIGAQVVELGPL